MRIAACFRSLGCRLVPPLLWLGVLNEAPAGDPIKVAEMGQSACVAAAADGSFMVAWADLSAAPDPRPTPVIYVQGFDNLGRALGEPRRVNEEDGFWFDTPETLDIASDGAGRYVVVWERQIELYGRVLGPAGDPLGDEFQITIDSYFPAFPSVEMNPSGEIAACWVGTPRDDGFNGVRLAKFDSDGTPIGAEIAVDGRITDDGILDMALTPSGQMVVSWVDFDGALRELKTRFYATDGTPGREDTLASLMVASGSETDFYGTSIDAGRDGSVAVSWGHIERTTQGNVRTIHLRWLGASGPFGPELIPEIGASFPSPDLAVAVLGQAVVAWDESNPTRQTYLKEIHRGGGDGVPFGAGTFQSDPDIEYDGLGRMVAAWTDHPHEPADIYVRQMPTNFRGTGPGAVRDEASTIAGSEVVIAVTLNDTDTSSGPLEAVSATDPPNGRTELRAPDAIAYIPDPGFSGTDRFSYTVRDAAGLVDSAEVVVRVTDGLDFDVWRTATFGVTNALPAAATSDPNGNGTDNLQSYAFGRDPLRLGEPPVQVGIERPAGGATLIYERPVGLSDLDYEVEVATALGAWRQVVVGEDYTESVEPAGDGMETVTVVVELEGKTAWFARVRSRLVDP